jgi:hypothetical protein
MDEWIKKWDAYGIGYYLFLKRNELSVWSLALKNEILMYARTMDES